MTRIPRTVIKSFFYKESKFCCSYNKFLFLGGFCTNFHIHWQKNPRVEIFYQTVWYYDHFTIVFCHNSSRISLPWPLNLPDMINEDC